MRLMKVRLMLSLVGWVFPMLASAATDLSLQQRLLHAFALPAEGLPGNYYVLRRTDPQTGAVRHLEYWLDIPAHRLLRREQFRDGSSDTVFASSRHGWRERAGSRVCLSAEERDQTLQSLRYHFLYLLAQPELTVQTIAPQRWQLGLPGIDAFQIELDGEGRICGLDFSAGLTGREFDYRKVDGVWWPFQFELMRDGVVTLHGEFTDFTVRTVAAEINAQDAAKTCTAP